MLILKKEIVEQIIEDAKKQSPNEACGIIAGSGERGVLFYPMENTDKSPVSYFMSPQQQLQVAKDIRNKGLEMLGIYHSHPHSEAYPSAKDVELAFYPEAYYIIVSLKDKDNPALRVFRIKDKKIQEQDFKVE